MNVDYFIVALVVAVVGSMITAITARNLKKIYEEATEDIQKISDERVDKIKEVHAEHITKIKRFCSSSLSDIGKVSAEFDKEQVSAIELKLKNLESLSDVERADLFNQINNLNLDSMLSHKRIEDMVVSMVSVIEKIR